MGGAIRYIIRAVRKDLKKSLGSRIQFSVLCGFLAGFAGVLILHLLGVC